ncbi:cupin domain-containing protein [filamentous cyanobacterium LEGE 11480]|uniref:Acireductone dioxygenase n=1 Tax=Romeriopsis navalis LEGE 11480 TaxID=2777977 RepID=A0A928Z2I8_9CYAN|nr:cupin domain-containing protein [Romeriopsis navalis]MBE9028430.1 cupin domain-containing protein [Romeriopsis navalis LEGE 11480]
MASLRLENGTTLTDLAAIAPELAPLNIQLSHWAVGDDATVQELLQKAALGDEEKEQVLVGVDRYFEQMKAEAGYTSRDLIVIHPEVPGLDVMLAKFDKIHTHADDEVRYIVEGEGIFGFVRPDGSQVELTVQAEEYINVPAGTEHWFYLTAAKRIKAVRYFIGTDGWVPEYTGTAIAFRDSAAV